MKTICVLLAFANTFGCFRSDAVADWLQTDSYRHRSDYRNNIWSYRNNTNVNEEEACFQTLTNDSIIEFGPHTDTESCQNRCQIYKWPVNNNDTGGYDVNISSLHLNENAGNYLIISPGPSLVRDEASVVITGEIQKPKIFRVIAHNGMTVLLVIPEGIANDTWMDNNFTLSYDPYELTTAAPDTTTPTYTYSTPESNVDYDATVYVSTVRDEKFNKEEFKEAVAKIANKYCERKNITITNETRPENVQLLLITGCPLTWPNWEKCIKIVMSVPVSVPANNTYELRRSSIEDMWKKYAEDELRHIGLKVYEVSDDNIILHFWLPISLGVAAIFTLLMVALWHFNIFNASNKKDAPMSLDQRTSNVSRQSWVSNNSYQEVPPMTDFQYDDIYNEPRENRQIVTTTNTLSVSHERPPASDQFSGAFYFKPQGYDNPSFDFSSERHHPSNAGYHDDYSSDDDSSANISTDTKSHHDHLHTAPKQVMNEDNNHESTL